MSEKYTIPVAAGKTVTLEGEFPMPGDQWETFYTVLRALQPGLTGETPAAVEDTPAPKAEPKKRGPKRGQKWVHHKKSPEFYAMVVAAWRKGGPKRVADEFGVSRGSAYRWADEAVERGELTAGERQQTKGVTKPAPDMVVFNSEGTLVTPDQFDSVRTEVLKNG